MANTDYKNVLLVSEDTIKTESYISDNLESKFILSAIRNAQEINLPIVLFSKALYRKLQALVYANQIDKPEYEQYKELLDDYVQNYLIAKTICNIIPLVNNKTDNFGTYSSSDERLQPKSDNKALVGQFQSNADFYANSTQEFLLANKDRFEELSNACATTEKTSATTGLWLGGNIGKGGSSCRPIENVILKMEGGDYNEGYEDGKRDGAAEQKAKLTPLNVTENGTYTREDGYNEVTVNVEGSNIKVENPSIDVTVPSEGRAFLLDQEYYMDEHTALGGNTTINVKVEGGGELPQLEYFAHSADGTESITQFEDGSAVVRAKGGYVRDVNNKDYNIANEKWENEIAFIIEIGKPLNVTQNGMYVVQPSLKQTEVNVNVEGGSEDKTIDHIYSDTANSWALQFPDGSAEEGKRVFLEGWNEDVTIGYTDDTDKHQNDVSYYHFYLKQIEKNTVEVNSNQTITIEPSLNCTEVNVNVNGGKLYVSTFPFYNYTNSNVNFHYDSTMYNCVGYFDIPLTSVGVINTPSSTSGMMTFANMYSSSSYTDAAVVDNLTAMLEVISDPSNSYHPSPVDVSFFPYINWNSRKWTDADALNRFKLKMGGEYYDTFKRKINGIVQLYESGIIKVLPKNFYEYQNLIVSDNLPIGSYDEDDEI